MPKTAQRIDGLLDRVAVLEKTIETHQRVTDLQIKQLQGELADRAKAESLRAQTEERLASALTRLAVSEDRVSTLQAKLDQLLAKQDAIAERQARSEERMAATEKEAEKWSGRVWQVILVVWTTLMGLLGAIALAVLGLKK